MNINILYMRIFLIIPLISLMVSPAEAQTNYEWSEPYRNWHYHPDLVIPSNPDIPGYEEVKMTDVPTVFQIPGDELWYISFIGFDGKGYQSFIAESEDLIHWGNYRLAMGYGPEGSFDYGGVVLGAYLYEDYDIKAPRLLKRKNGKYYSLYGAYPRQGGYELRPGYEGIAQSEDGLNWERADNDPILSVYQDDCGAWEQSCIYQPWLVEHNNRYFNLYNAANGSIEQMGLAVSSNLFDWKRYQNNPVIPNGRKGSFNDQFSSDIKVFRDNNHWVGFFFGVGQGGAHIMAAYSDDLYHWTVDPEPLYKAGDNPSGIDEKYAHKISLVWNPENQTYYMYYCAVDKDGNRGIGLISSKSLSQSANELDLHSEENELNSYLNAYNVVWQSPSLNSLGSMPAGNGDIGINLWVEGNGDLLFYISKTDAWSENARLLKIGKVRLSLSPNPFKTGMPFLQELVLQDGVIHIEAGEKKEKVAIDVWVDANHPLIELEIKSQKPVVAKVSTEPWRTHSRELSDKKEIHSAYGLQSATVSKDSIIDADQSQVIWAHRNEKSVWSANMKLQGLEEYMQESEDPLMYRTFGALIQSDQLQKVSSFTLENRNPSREISALIIVHTAQTETLDDWIGEIQQSAKNIDSELKAERRQEHQDWWMAFWNRSYIHVSTLVEGEQVKVFNVSRGYALQRYMNACSGRGNSPIKFNGSIFTVDTKDLQGKYHGFDADYRQWGGPYWWQNTRLPYWSMLEAGDFDLILPLFKMYRDALDVRKFATQKYYGHDGAFFPETMRHWGTYVESNYGEDRSELPIGLTQNRFIRYYWQGGLELSLMMLDYYSFTQDSEILKETILPVVKEVINFFDKHWGRDENDKILFEPAMALETYNTAVNPLPEIVGINKVCSELLNLPVEFFGETERQQFSRLIQELPEIPMQELNGKKVLAPAHEYSGKQNIENPELYAVFPYRMYGLGKENLMLARRTFENRLIKQTGGWQQNAIKAAYLGLTEEAAKLTTQNFNTSNNQFRFPAMWGPNYDWIPDQDHGTVAMIALQRMLMQYEGDEIYLFPAWPDNWDVQFKLSAPKSTTVTATLKNGKVTQLKVTPWEREKDIISKFNK